MTLTEYKKEKTTCILYTRQDKDEKQKKIDYSAYCKNISVYTQCLYIFHCHYYCIMREKNKIKCVYK